MSRFHINNRRKVKLLIYAGWFVRIITLSIVRPTWAYDVALANAKEAFAPRQFLAKHEAMHAQFKAQREARAIAASNLKTDDDDEDPLS